jgi:hypothetical protein
MCTRDEDPKIRCWLPVVAGVLNGFTFCIKYWIGF